MSDPRTGSDKPTESVSTVPQGILFGTASLGDLLDGVVLDVEQLEGLEGIEGLEDISDEESSDSNEESSDSNE